MQTATEKTLGEAADPKPSPPARLSREDEAKRALEHTAVTPLTAWALTLLFLLTIGAVPVVQHVVEIRANLRARAEERAATGAAPEGRLLPQSWDVLALLPSRERPLPGVGEIQEFEASLEEQSAVSAWLLPRAQGVLAGRLGAGNEQAYLGQGGWLHYRPDVDYVTSRGFLDPALLQQRRRAGDASAPAVQPDPVTEIVRFREQLAARGITLIVMPVPVKPMIHPETLSASYDAATALPLQNPSWEPFRRALEREGVLVFDAAPLLAAAKRRTGEAQYLRADTHWTPEAMERSARALADFIAARVPSLPRRAPVAYTRGTTDAENLGDIAAMLKLPPGQRLYPPQKVRLHPVRTPGGAPWRPDRTADILLLGDSFSNIYSLGGMGWGEGAGFAEQLSAALGRPLDRIVINAGGSYTTRQRLRGELLRGRDRLAGKRLVVYQFAARDLLIGDWKRLDLPPPRKEKAP